MAANSALGDRMAHKRPSGGRMTKAKAALRGLVASKSRPRCTKARQIESRKESQSYKSATKRQGKILEAPVRSQIPCNICDNDSNYRGINSIATCRGEINRYIWGDNAGPNDEEDVIASRVYSMLQLENNPVLEFSGLD